MGSSKWGVDRLEALRAGLVDSSVGLLDERALAAAESLQEVLQVYVDGLVEAGDRRVVAGLVAADLVRLLEAFPGPVRCVVCGCTDEAGCFLGCSWVVPAGGVQGPICSMCVDVAQVGAS